MRINVNLASQQYQDAREFYTRWGGALILALLITAALAFLAWSNYKTTARDSKNVRDLREKIAQIDRQVAEAEAKLNLPENRDVRDQSQFWNDVIDRKSLSWTQLFSDLEKIMPLRTYVINVQPSITPERRLQLKMVFVGEKFDDANELLSKMEHSERFRLPELIATRPAPANKQELVSAAAPAWEFQIATYYTPAAPGPLPQAAAVKKGA